MSPHQQSLQARAFPPQISICREMPRLEVITLRYLGVRCRSGCPGLGKGGPSVLLQTCDLGQPGHSRAPPHAAVQDAQMSVCPSTLASAWFPHGPGLCQFLCTTCSGIRNCHLSESLSLNRLRKPRVKHVLSLGFWAAGERGGSGPEPGLALSPLCPHRTQGGRRRRGRCCSDAVPTCQPDGASDSARRTPCW